MEVKSCDIKVPEFKEKKKKKKLNIRTHHLKSTFPNFLGKWVFGVPTLPKSAQQPLEQHTF